MANANLVFSHKIGMSREDIEKSVKEIVTAQLGVAASAVTNDASFVDDLGANSLDYVELIMDFEEEFGINIPEEDAEKITKVSHIIDYAFKKLNPDKK